MARMIPAERPDETSSPAEAKLYWELKAQLEDEYTIVHSLPWLRDTKWGLREGECDFLILHPLRGLLALEAKSGDIRYCGEQDKWFRGGSALIQDPFAQARRSSHYFDSMLAKRVPEWKRIRPPFGYAAALPDTDTAGEDWPHLAKPKITVLKPHMAHVGERIEKILDHWRSPTKRLSPEGFRAVRNAILPQFSLTCSVSARRETAERLFFRMEKRQRAILEAAADNPRLLVEGVAGSGKTVLAIERARQLAEEGKRVLLVCYNILLAEHLESRMVELNAEADVCHFHGICRRAVEETGGKWGEPPHDAPQAQLGEFWNHEASEMLDKALHGSWTVRYDSIVVDEGQDFCEHWWGALEKLLADPAKSDICIFRDLRQNIFDRDTLERPLGCFKLRLKTNCRNSARIALRVHKHGGVTEAEILGSTPVGEDPVVDEVSSRTEQLKAVRRALQEMVVTHKREPQDVVIIGEDHLEDTPFAKEQKLCGLTVVPYRISAGKNEVRYATLRRFKGLETDCAIVCLSKSSQVAGDYDTRFYVTGSRARTLLHVIVMP